MRKDVRTGAVIGGILLAVMIVYAIVVSSGHKKKDKVTLDSGKTSTTGDGVVGADRSTSDAAGPSHDDSNDPLVALTHEPLTAGTPPTPAHAAEETSATPASPADSSEAKSTTNWGALLSADHVENVLPAKMHTPAAQRPVVDMPAADAPTHLPPTELPAKLGNRTSESHVRATDTMIGGTTHRIASDETFSSIARTAYGNARYYKEIIKANPKVDPNHLRPGMVITLPDKSSFAHDAAPVTPAAVTSEATETKHHPLAAVSAVNSASQYRVQANDNLYKISMKLYHSANKVDAIYQLNKTTIGADPAKLKLNMVLKLPEPPTQTASR